MQLVKGENLTTKQKEQVRNAFLFRHTWENGYLGHISDEEWIKKHAFYIDSKGKLASRPAYCEPACLAG